MLQPHIPRFYVLISSHSYLLPPIIANPLPTHAIHFQFHGLELCELFLKAYQEYIEKKRKKIDCVPPKTEHTRNLNRVPKQGENIEPPQVVVSCVCFFSDS